MKDLLQVSRQLEFGNTEGFQKYASSLNEGFSSVLGKDVQPDQKPFGSQIILVLLQGLIDLAFLEERFLQKRESLEACQPTDWPQELKSSIRQFLVADQEFTYRHHLGLGKTPYTVLVPLCAARLQQLTALDGEFTVSKPLTIGHNSILARVMHFRLRSLGQYYEPIERPISQMSIIGGRKMLLLCGQIEHDQMQQVPSDLSAKIFNLSGNIPKLAVLFSLKRPGPAVIQQLEQFNTKNDQFFYINEKHIVHADDKRAFRRELRQHDIKPKDGLEWRDSLGDYTTLQYTDINQFRMELLMNLLWMYGYHNLRIAAFWSSQMLEPLYEFINQHQLKKTDAFIGFSNGFALLNTDLLFSAFQQYLVPSAIKDVEQYITVQLQQKEKSAQATKNKVSSDENWLKRMMNQVKNFGERVYYGTRSLIRSAAQKMPKVWNWLKTEVLGPVFSLIKYLASKLKEKVRHLLRSLISFGHLLFRAPFISKENNGLIATFYDFDYDLKLVSLNASPSLIAKHKFGFAEMNEQAKYFLETASLVMMVIKGLSSPIGWLSLGLKVIKVIK